MGLAEQPWKNGAGQIVNVPANADPYKQGDASRGVDNSNLGGIMAGVTTGAGSQVGGYHPAPTAPAASTPGAPVTFKADTNAALDALSGKYTQHLDDLENNSGKIMDIAGQRMRDAREGGRRSMSDTMTLSGKATDPAAAQYEADTTRGVEGAIADTEAQREAQLTSALQGGVAVHSASPELALKEKQFQAGVYGQQQQAQAQEASANFDRFLALLNSQRTSPIYTGAPAAAATPRGGVTFGAVPVR